jgi:cytosine/adenosine deaminase-related metal-dependent hydrolase
MIGGRPYSDKTTLIKGGYVLTLDPELGDLPLTDVLIDGDKIAAVGRNLEVSPNANVIDARNRIVMPGFVDTHRHTWQTPVRGVLPSCTLDQYFSGMLDNIGIQYRAEDVYIANLMGALECLNSGITTLLDWSHVNNTPEHADAAIAGLTEAGIRAVYAHGPPVGASKWWAYSSAPHPEDVRRIRKQYFNSDDQLLTLALAARAPGNTTPEVATHDWKLARDLGIRISVHVGMRLTGVHVHHVKTLSDLGLMGPDTTYIHCTDSTDEELDRRGARSDRQVGRHGVRRAVRRDADGSRRAADGQARRARRAAVAVDRRRVECSRRHVHADAHGARAGTDSRLH